jgi:hypothetical protein
MEGMAEFLSLTNSVFDGKRPQFFRTIVQIFAFFHFGLGALNCKEIALFIRG